MSRGGKVLASAAVLILVAWFFGVGVLVGEHWGVSYEKRQQVADYNDGWTDGRNDLLQQQWDAHNSGKEYLDPAKCELLSTPDYSQYWYECKAPKGGFK